MICRSKELNACFGGRHVFGLLLTHIWPWVKLVSKLAVDPCRKTAFFCTGLQVRPFASHRLQTGRRLSHLWWRAASHGLVMTTLHESQALGSLPLQFEQGALANGVSDISLTRLCLQRYSRRGGNMLPWNLTWPTLTPLGHKRGESFPAGEISQ